MQETLFDTVLADSLAGFRLQRLELLNWGTFDRHIWKIEPNGWNGLLTGDVGSGKSTLVDALTTLLVPHHRITYNKAAGAQAKERTLNSYIRGEYKNEKDDNSQSAKAVTLRGQNSYTVLLAVFHNEGYAQSVSLAQVFWLKDQGRGNPERFFVLAQTPLSIAEHFSAFGPEILELKKRLRKQTNVEVMESFRDYSGKFRTLFGIGHEQALELFYQTISMKSVGNLTQFVRLHMLEPNDVEPRIEELRQNFENLNRSHEAVLKAKRQIELLTPIVEEGTQQKLLQSSVAMLREGRNALEAYFGTHKLRLLELRLEDLNLEIGKLTQQIESTREQHEYLENQARSLKEAIHQQGGARLETIAREMQLNSTHRDRAKLLRQTYDELAKKMELRTLRDESSFTQNRASLTEQAERRIEELKKNDEAKVKSAVALQELKARIEALQQEITSLKSRRSNIPSRNLTLRNALCEAIEVTVGELPFAGELLQVAAGEEAWEGAIERVVHNLGLSLLVPERLYAKVTQYIELTQLRGRIVYFRTTEEGSPAPRHRDADNRSLANKLRIRPETPFYAWLEGELYGRFDYVCTETLEDFRRQPFAITKNGQIKAGGKRHEKDDRHSLSDRSTYILGWSNEAKLQVLQDTVASWINEAQRLAQDCIRISVEQAQLQAKRDHGRDLLRFESFAELHWQAFARRVQELEDERRQIEESSDVLKTLQAQLVEILTSIKESSQRYQALHSDRGAAQERLRSLTEQRETAHDAREGLAEEERTKRFPTIDAFCSEALSDKKLTLQNIDRAHSELRNFLQNRIDAEDRKIDRLTQKLISQMEQYKIAYPAESKDLDASLEAIQEFSSLLAQLHGEDLPRHEERFKQLLNEGTINSVALLQNHLERGRKGIEEKISAINLSLREIEYSKGTFIKLVQDRTQDREIREFQHDLKRCLAEGLRDEAIYNEQRFLQVKAILERLNGRKDTAELDRRWALKVTDVRNWFEFSASERWAADDTEKEFYSDSAGKSGGQKEKLAYTVLASALAYQFGLEWNATRSRSFRFVVIDEAFGRGSDESTRYGMELFKKLNLQLLVVTPMQKIHVIEDYVRSIHYVHNEDGRNSMVRNLTIEEYRADRANYAQAAELLEPTP